MINREVKSSERRRKLRVFIRVGLFAIALALAAIALIRTFHVLKETRLTQDRLATGEEQRRTNNELRALSSLRVKNLVAARWNADFVERFYQCCREPSDLPQITTDFIVHEDASFASGQTEMTFSVPVGTHTLQLWIQQSVASGMDPMSGEITKVEFPLLASSGYVVRIFPKGPDREGESAAFSIDLSSNNASFEPVNAKLPIPNTQGIPRLPEVLNVFPDKLGSRLGWKTQRIEAKDLYLTYPNSRSLIAGNSVIQKHGLALAYCHLLANDLPMSVHLSLKSDAPACATAEVARQLSRLNNQGSQIEPYTGNGRFYIGPAN